MYELKKKDLHVLPYTSTVNLVKVTCVQSLRWNFQTSTKKRNKVLLHPSKDVGDVAHYNLNYLYNFTNSTTSPHNF